MLPLPQIHATFVARCLNSNESLVEEGLQGLLTLYGGVSERVLACAFVAGLASTTGGYFVLPHE